MRRFSERQAQVLLDVLPFCCSRIYLREYKGSRARWEHHRRT